MKNLLALALLLTGALLAAPRLRADSPLTSTDFYGAYLDIPLVKEARDAGVLNDKMCAYLADPKNPIDAKAALINALGWDSDGKENSKIYVQYLAKLRNIDTNKELDDMGKLFKGDDYFCAGYLLALDDYFNVENALPFMELAVQNNPTSYTVSIIRALIRAQIAMDDMSNWCGVWKEADAVYQNKGLKLDLREKGRKAIYDYMVLYKAEC